MTEESLIQIDRSGFFPEEEESKSQFLLAYRELFSRFPKGIDSDVEWLGAAKKQFYHFFQVIPCWVRASITKKGVLPWELAACWQYTDGEALIHVRPSLEKEKKEDQAAVLMHELVHAVRSRLSSVCFEEIIAFEAMKTRDVSRMFRIRSFLARACVDESDSMSLLCWHILLFVLVMLGGLSLPGYFCFLGLFWSCLACRGWWLISTWKRAFCNIEKAFPHKGWPFLLRATDRDVVFVASLSENMIRTRIEERAQSEWRWEYLLKSLLQNS